METSHIESKRSCVADVRRQQGPHDVTKRDQAAEDVGRDACWAASLVKASHPARVEEASVGLHAHMTATDLETHLVRAIAVRTHGQVQALRVQILGGRTVLSGFAESYYAIQLAVVGLQETLDALGLDRPGRVDLNIDVMPSVRQDRERLDRHRQLIIEGRPDVMQTYVLGEGGEEHDRDTKESDV